MSFVAISKVVYPASLKRDIHAVGLEILPVARSRPGLVSVAFHRSKKTNETMMYWEWELQSDHEACMQSEESAAIMEKHAAIFSHEGVKLSIETYERQG
jgi:quinol monooxygenase YgiN